MTTPVKAMAIATTACLGIASPPAPEARVQDVSCLVTTVNGDIQGQDRGGSCAFLGIPFAAPPTGTLRWKAPQPAQPWTGVLDATVTPATCALIGGNGLPAGREDRLR
jgi:para-nitrobenzyl esterase